MDCPRGKHRTYKLHPKIGLQCTLWSSFILYAWSAGLMRRLRTDAVGFLKKKRITSEWTAYLQGIMALLKSRDRHVRVRAALPVHRGEHFHFCALRRCQEANWIQYFEKYESDWKLGRSPELSTKWFWWWLDCQGGQATLFLVVLVSHLDQTCLSISPSSQVKNNMSKGKGGSQQTSGEYHKPRNWNILLSFHLSCVTTVNLFLYNWRATVNTFH